MKSLHHHMPLFVATGILLVATGLQVIGLDIYTLNGDEYNSMAEATTFGLNWNSLPYFALLSPWQRAGSQAVWLRLPAVFSGVVAVAGFYTLGKVLSGTKFGVVVSLLAATSPFLVYQSQQVRFYSFLVLTTVLFLIALALTVKRGARSLIWSAAAGVLLILSHFLGLVALFLYGAAGVTAAITNRRLRTITGVVFLVGIAVLFVLPTIPAFTNSLWSAYQSIANTTVAKSPEVTPLSVINIVKIGFAVYVFGLGYHVYPMWLWLSVPFLIALLGLLIVGAARFGRIAPRWEWLPFFAAVGLAGVYVVLDSVGGRLAGGVAPRHVAFIWPVVILVLGAGILQLPRRVAGIALVGLVVLNMVALVPRWQQSWSYVTLQDYRAAADFATLWLGDTALLLYDGRSAAPIEFYFPESGNTANYHNETGAHQLEIDEYDQILFMSNDFQLERRRLATDVIDYLTANDFHVQAGRVVYPLFQYVFLRNSVDFPVSESTGQIAQPVTIYDGQFEHLELPVVVDVEGKRMDILGAFTVSGDESNREHTIALQAPIKSGVLTLVTNVAEAESLFPNELIAEFVVEATDGGILILPIRMHSETTGWNDVCAEVAPCTTVYQWQKKISLVGEASYTGAYQQFDAGLHGVLLPLPDTVEIEKLTVRYSADAGQLVIWGLGID